MTTEQAMEKARELLAEYMQPNALSNIAAALLRAYADGMKITLYPFTPTRKRYAVEAARIRAEADALDKQTG